MITLQHLSVPFRTWVKQPVEQVTILWMKKTKQFRKKSNAVVPRPSAGRTTASVSRLDNLVGLPVGASPVPTQRSPPATRRRRNRRERLPLDANARKVSASKTIASATKKAESAAESADASTVTTASSSTLRKSLWKSSLGLTGKCTRNQSWSSWDWWCSPAISVAFSD